MGKSCSTLRQCQGMCANRGRGAFQNAYSVLGRFNAFLLRLERTTFWHTSQLNNISLAQGTDLRTGLLLCFILCVNIDAS